MRPLLSPSVAASEHHHAHSLICSQIAYMSNRAYVYQPYLQHPKTWSRAVRVPDGRWQSRTIPLNAIIQGPAVGSYIGPGQTGTGEWANWHAPRSVSNEFFDQVCPWWQRTYVDIKAFRKKYDLWDESLRKGKSMVEAFAEHLAALNDSCIVVENEHLFTSRCSPSLPILLRCGN